MNDQEPLRPQVASPFWGWALSKVTNVRGNQCNYDSVGGKTYFCLSMTMGCGLVTLESCGSVGGWMCLRFV